MDLTNKKILVTGGGSGIGKALIEEFSKNGVTDIAVVGRTAKKLDDLEEQFPSVRFLNIRGDVSKPDDVKKTAAIVREQWGELDILVNNAGVVSAGLLEDISDKDIVDQININLTGLILMTKHFLPLIKGSREGAVMNISSGLGFIARPFYSVYAATKSGVKHFSEAMRRELADYPIHVMTVYPTSTDTEMMESANAEGMDRPEKVARASVEGLLKKEIDVILGGRKRLKDIRTNFEAPLKMDDKVKKQFETLRKRAESHHSM